MVKKNSGVDIPPSTKTRKPTTKKSFSLDDFKKKIGDKNIPDKPLEWYKCSSALSKSTGLPGAPKGYVTLFRGYSNTGKSTALCEYLVAAQKAGDLPIIIDTENNLGKYRLEMMGFDWDGDYILIDNSFLLEQFGKKQDKDRREASIEDMAEAIRHLLLEQEQGNLPFNLAFGIDSIGTLNCIATINALEKNTSDNNMWNAGAYEKAFMYILNNTFPDSRKEDKPYTNTLCAVQKVWLDSMNGKVIKHKGGETFKFGSRLIFHFGGILSPSTQAVTADSKKRTVSYGIDTKVKVEKNHIDGPLGGISLQGKIMSMPHGFIFKEELEEYKKENILYFRNIFDDDSITADQINDTFVDIKEDGKLDINDLTEKAAGDNVADEESSEE
jgi:hypothetical protein